MFLSQRLSQLLIHAELVPASDYQLETRGRNPYVLLGTVDAVRRVARQDVDRPRGIRRTYMRSPTSPYADQNGIVLIYAFHDFLMELFVAKKIAEEMIRSGELLMSEPPETYQQDLYWRDDPWFQENRRGVIGSNRGPYIP